VTTVAFDYFHQRMDTIHAFTKGCFIGRSLAGAREKSDLHRQKKLARAIGKG
jgi:hypothetical protein